ncbi:MAG: hypothetical protein Q7R68_01825 [Nitrospirales bacterium]|nr:hypothetical protein [Nitrospirales bacterium]
MTENKKFPICDSLSVNPAKHCAALVVTENAVKDQNGWPQFAQPSDELRNGTLTYVKAFGKVYGITCWHVIEHFRKQLSKSGNQYSHSMRTMVNGFYDVQDRFIRPQPQLGDQQLDIAIRKLGPDFAATIGKIPLDLDAQTPATLDIEHGYAVGFPETMKHKMTEDHKGYRISMPQAEILAEIKGLPTRRFALHSELESKPSQTDYSGMSGGPIFWSTEDSYGIFGIIYEAGVGSELSEGKSVYVFGEVATPDLIKGWLCQLPA